MPFLVIGCIPVDDETNRARSGALTEPGEVPPPIPPPYKDSERVTCGGCGGQAWIGPEQRKTRDRFTALGLPPAIMCLTCCAIGEAVTGEELAIVSLSSKHAGE